MALGECDQGTFYKDINRVKGIQKEKVKHQHRDAEQQEATISQMKRRKS